MSHSLARPRGSALVVTIVVVLILVVVTGALLTATMLGSESVATEQQQLDAFQAAEGGIDQARAFLAGSKEANSAALAQQLGALGDPANAVEWDAGTGTWVAHAGALWNAATDDVGLDGQAGTNDQGEGDGFPTSADPSGPATPGEPNVRLFRRGATPTDPHLVLVHGHWWGGDGVDNNDDGKTDGDDPVEGRTYRLRATGIVDRAVVELETLVTRTLPPDIDPEDPPSGLLSAVSVHAAGTTPTPSGTVRFFNAAAANDINGDDHASTIAGAPGADPARNTWGIQLAPAGTAVGQLALAAANPTRVIGQGGQSGAAAMTGTGTFLGDVIDRLADGTKRLAVHKDTGAPSTNAAEQAWGSASDLKFVYHDAGAHGALRVSSRGFGLLVVDVDAVTTTPVLTFAGNDSSWEGIVIVRVKQTLAPDTPNGVVQSMGQGGGAGQTGTVVVYAKGAANFTGTNPCVMKNNGNRETRFSFGAVQKVLEAFNDEDPPTEDPTVSAPLLWRPIRQAGQPSGQPGR